MCQGCKNRVRNLQGRILFSVKIISANVEDCLHMYIIDDVMLTDYARSMIILKCWYSFSDVP